MLTSAGEVVYVGKSKRVRTRLLSYFRCAFPEEKGARILREADRIEWDYTPSEFAALLEELRLIKRLRPRFNVAMKRDGRNFCFLKLTRGAAPKFLVVRGPSHDDASVYYGPFQGAQRVGDAVRELNDALGLRDCANDQAMHFADQRELFSIFPRTPGCIRFEVKKCLGPCVGGCSAHEYGERVKLARGFLDGANDGPTSFTGSNRSRSNFFGCVSRWRPSRSFTPYRDTTGPTDCTSSVAVASAAKWISRNPPPTMLVSMRSSTKSFRPSSVKRPRSRLTRSTNCYCCRVGSVVSRRN
jgi:hypothetical protein